MDTNQSTITFNNKLLELLAYVCNIQQSNESISYYHYDCSMKIHNSIKFIFRNNNAGDTCEKTIMTDIFYLHVLIDPS